MKCENCGTENRDEAVTCAICRAPLITPVNNEIKYVPNYVLPSLVILILFSPIGGIISLIYALKANQLAREGKFELALRKAKIAKIWLIISVAIGITAALIIIILQSMGIKIPYYTY